MELQQHERYGLVLTLLVLLLWSGYAPQINRFIWLLETLPVFIALPLLIRTYHLFAFTRLAYLLLWLLAIIIIIGGHYGYAQVPAFNWLRDTLALARNDYDRLAHFILGVVAAIVAREILLRKTPLHPDEWLFGLVCAMVLAIGACYEFLEWWVALLGGAAANPFLATQGDQWDTQWDLFLALIGAIVSQLLFSNIHNQQLNQREPMLFMRKVRW